MADCPCLVRVFIIVLLEAWFGIQFPRVFCQKQLLEPIIAGALDAIMAGQYADRQYNRFIEGKSPFLKPLVLAQDKCSIRNEKQTNTCRQSPDFPQQLIQNPHFILHNSTRTAVNRLASRPMQTFCLR